MKRKPAKYRSLRYPPVAPKASPPKIGRVAQLMVYAPPREAQFGTKVSYTQVLALATKHLSKALQVNGKAGVRMIEAYATLAGEETELGRVLLASLKLAKEQFMILDVIDMSSTARDIETRKFYAQARTQDKYDSARFSPLPFGYPSGFHKPRILSPDFWEQSASRIVAEAASRMQPPS